MPVVLADGQKMLLVDACKKNLVVPEMYDRDSGWQNIWAQAEDRISFVALNNLYLVMKKKWFITIGARDFPPFRKIEYDCHSQFYLSDRSWLNSETELFNKCKELAASTRRKDIKISSYSLPSSLQDFPKADGIKLLSDSLLAYLHQINIPSSTNPLGEINRKFHEYGFYAEGTYQNRGTSFEYSQSCILKQLRQLKWLPTTKGFVKPSQAFLPKAGIKEILGDTVPYFEETLSENICKLLEIRSEVTVIDLIGLIRDHSGSDKPNQEMIERVYDELFIRTERISLNIKAIFSKESLIYVSSGNQGKKWFNSGECVWEEAADILGNEFTYIQKKYPKMVGFFVSRLGVKERIDTECYAKYWLKLQDTPLTDLKKQRELLERLYREIKPISLMSDDERPGWWNDYFFDQAKLYSQSDTFCDATDIILPDDKIFQNMFKDTKDVQFAWYPDYGSFSDWLGFFRKFYVPLLSESITEKLVENVAPEIIKINRYVTESAIKMIASWLREKRQTEYDELLSNDTFKHLLRLRESPVTTDIDIEFCLETDSYIYDSQNELYPAFWDRSAHILYYNSGISKSKLAQVLAKPLTTNYKDLAVWIEVVLEADSTERIKDLNWNVPREIIDLLSKKKSSPQSDKEPLEEDSIVITPSFECIENDAESLELEITTSCLDKKEADAEEHFKSTLESLPPIAQASSPASLSSNNKPNMPELNIVQHKDPIGNE